MSKKIMLVVMVVMLTASACIPFFSTQATLDAAALQKAVDETLAASGLIQNQNPEVPADQGSGDTGGNIVLPPTATATVTTQPTLTPTVTIVPPAAPCTNIAHYIDDVTIEDGTELNKSQAFTKTWRLENVGTCTWSSGYKIVYDHGDQMSGPAENQLTSGLVAPGQQVDVSINMTAPAAVGEYKGYWKFKEPSGIIFALTTGNPVSVEIKVVDSGASPIVPLIPLLPLLPLVLNPYTEQVYTQVNVSGNDVGWATATCPANTVVVGGGFAGNSNLVIYTHSQEGNGWRAYAKNYSGSGQLLNAYAVCLHYSGGTTSQKYSQVTINAGEVNNADIACPAGSIATGGGYASSADNIWVYNSSMNGNGWRVYGKNLSGSSQLLNAYVMCLSGTSGSSTSTHSQITIAGGDSDGGEIACAGSVATGGGFALSDGLTVYNTSMKSGDGKTWNTFARNSSGSGKLLNTYVVCVTFP
jgi:hypothetical protein